MFQNITFITKPPRIIFHWSKGRIAFICNIINIQKLILQPYKMNLHFDTEENIVVDSNQHISISFTLVSIVVNVVKVSSDIMWYFLNQIRSVSQTTIGCNQSSSSKRVRVGVIWYFTLKRSTAFLHEFENKPK